MSAVVPHLRSLRTRLAALHSASPGLLRWLQPHRLSVANKLKATLWICGLGLVAIAAVYAWTGHANALAARSQASYQRGSDLAASLSTRVAEARRLQTQYARSFDDADRAQLLATQKALQTDLQALRAMPMDAGRRKALQALTEAADAFSQGVAALFERVDEMGRGDAGLAAQLQQAADTLQAQVDVQQRPALALSLQKMRRQEALLLLDGDSTHADRASEEKLPFDLALAGLPADVQDTLRTGMEAYQAALLGYTAARVGLDVEAQSLLDTATGVAPALAAFQQAQVAALARAQARQQAGARTMSVVFALTLLLVAGVLITAWCWCCVRCASRSRTPCVSPATSPTTASTPPCASTTPTMKSASWPSAWSTCSSACARASRPSVRWPAATPACARHWTAHRPA